jgi:HEPN domain-containing protein
MKRATREWVQKAEEDHAQAEQTAIGARPSSDHITFDCQQSAEKYLKALLEELGLHIPKTHDLERLFNELLSHHSRLRSLRRGFKFLSQFAVSPRYPGFHTTKRQAVAALRWAGRVRTTCRTILGLKSP